MYPEGAALGGILAHECEARDLRVVSVLIRSAQFLQQRQRASGLVGAADVDQTREMGEVIRHGDPVNGEDPAETPGVVLE